jgi:hypothetical protein
VTALARRIGLRRRHAPLLIAAALVVSFLLSFAAGYLTTG